MSKSKTKNPKPFFKCPFCRHGKFIRYTEASDLIRIVGLPENREYSEIVHEIGSEVKDICCAECGEEV